MSTAPAVVARDRSDDRAEHRRDDRDEERDPERGPEPEDDAAQIVAPELVGPEQVPTLERRALHDVLEVELVVRVRSDLLREDRDESGEDQEHEARDREPMPEEAHTGVRPLAAGLDLEAALVAELEVRWSETFAGRRAAADTRPRRAGSGRVPERVPPQTDVLRLVGRPTRHVPCAQSRRTRGSSQPYARSAMRLKMMTNTAVTMRNAMTG